MKLYFTYEKIQPWVCRIGVVAVVSSHLISSLVPRRKPKDVQKSSTLIPVFNRCCCGPQWLPSHLLSLSLSLCLSPLVACGLSVLGWQIEPGYMPQYEFLSTLTEFTESAHNLVESQRRCTTVYTEILFEMEMVYTMQMSCFIRVVSIFESSRNLEGIKNNTEST